LKGEGGIERDREEREGSRGEVGIKGLRGKGRIERRGRD
jgi:hypothetical protein